MSFDEEIAELRAILLRLVEKTDHQRLLLDELQHQIARFNVTFYPYQQPISTSDDQQPREESTPAASA